MVIMMVMVIVVVLGATIGDSGAWVIAIEGGEEEC